MGHRGKSLFSSACRAIALSISGVAVAVILWSLAVWFAKNEGPAEVSYLRKNDDLTGFIDKFGRNLIVTSVELRPSEINLLTAAGTYQVSCEAGGTFQSETMTIVADAENPKVGQSAATWLSRQSEAFKSARMLHIGAGRTISLQQFVNSNSASSNSGVSYYLMNRSRDNVISISVVGARIDSWYAKDFNLDEMYSSE